MMPFTNRLTVIVSSIGGGVSFILSLFRNFSDIQNFHGNWLRFITYLLEGLAQSGINGLTVFLICAIIAFPLIRILEYKSNRSRIKKT